LGPIAILVNNAANDERHATEEVTSEYWDGRIAVNLKHQFFAAQAVLADMKAKGGVIINFGSVSWMVGQGGMAAYTASKSAVLGLHEPAVRRRWRVGIAARLQAGGAPAPGPSSRCIRVVSHQRPNLKPTALRRPTCSNPRLAWSAMEAGALSPMTAIICRKPR